MLGCLLTQRLLLVSHEAPWSEEAHVVEDEDASFADEALNGVAAIGVHDQFDGVGAGVACFQVEAGAEDLDADYF